MYCLIYDKYRLTSLPWNSLSTWLLTLVLADFCFYWFHRMSHGNYNFNIFINKNDLFNETSFKYTGINIFWAVHQAHHSSEDFNLATALRISPLLPFYSWVMKMIFFL